MEDTPPTLCENPECRKPAATMQCPTCIKLGLPPAYFCNKDCFKSFWAIHKLFHKKGESSLIIVTDEETKTDDYAYTGPLRPHKKSGWRSVPDSIKKPDYAKTSKRMRDQASP